MKIYTHEEYISQVVKDTKKLSEHFANLSEAIKNDDRPQKRILFKKIARLIGICRNVEGYYHSLTRYMDISYYKWLEKFEEINK